MRTNLLLLALACLLSGCIIFDKKSEAVTFHQLSAPTASASRAAPVVFVPRAILPSALRRPNIVILDDNGWVRIDDAHRWISPLDRAVAETVGRHLTARTGLPSVTQQPAEDHLVLLLTVDKMEAFEPATSGRSLFSIPGASANKDTAVLQLTCRLEKSDGTLLAARTFAASTPLRERTPTEFVLAQSANFASISTDIAKLLTIDVPSTK